jgi:transketolase
MEILLKVKVTGGGIINTRDWRREIGLAAGDARIKLIEEFAIELKIRILTTVHKAGIGHVGGDLSVSDILSVLFGDVLRIDPKEPFSQDRDRFIMSKGHAAASLYSAMALVGFFAEVELETFAKHDSRLGGHPNRKKLPGIESNTGPLGHGLPVAVGIATGNQILNKSGRVYVVTGDGELQEGSNWEAIMYAGHRSLSNLTLIVDKNDLQQGARVSQTNSLDPLDDKLRAFNWHVSLIDGHDHALLRQTLLTPVEKPHAIVALTTKGRGVSFMENCVEWHHKVPSTDQIEQALKELKP